MSEKQTNKPKNVAAGVVKGASSRVSEGKKKIALLPGAKPIPPAAVPKAWDYQG